MGVPELTSRQKDNHEDTFLRVFRSQHSWPWPWLLLRSKLLNLAPTLTRRLIPGTATMGMEVTGEATVATTDPMGIMVTTERGLPMKPPPLDPTLRLQLILGTATMGMEATERGLPMRPPPPNLDPTLMLRLIPGTGTTGTATTDHTDMGTMALATGDTTGDKKWTSKTTSKLFLPTHL